MSDESTLETKKAQFELRDNGEVHHNKKGKSAVLAKYDDDTGVLTMEGFAIDQKYRTQIVRAVMEDAMTGELTGHAVKGYAIAGRPFDKIRKGEPLPPKKDKMLGDKTPAFVRWMFKWRPQAAYARYGVLLDSNGEPRTANCARLEQGLLLPDTGKALKLFGDGKDALGSTYLEVEDGILATRQSCMTFTTKEVLGSDGDEETEDEEPIPAGAGEADEADEADDEKPAGRRKNAKSVKDEDAD